MILPHLSASARVIAASSAGEDDAVSTAMSSIRFLTSGRDRIADLGIEPTDDLARHSGGTVGGVQKTTGTYG
jgi:hypothetical protein